MTSPWPEIWTRDEGRCHGLAEAVAEYDRLLAAYHACGLERVILPKTGVAAPPAPGDLVQKEELQ